MLFLFSFSILSGLPFHHHGESWLGLVYGMKRWFLYPPGASPPRSLERTHHPLGTVSDWFNEVYPKLTRLGQPPINGGLPVTQGPEHEGYRPLECVQMQGDVMYVPATWNHLTINIGKLGWSDSDGVMSWTGEG
jgi:histone arginine demethylase JMJD6